MKRTAMALWVVLCWLAGPAQAGGPVRAMEPGGRDLEAPRSEESFTFAVFGDRVPGGASGLAVLERAVQTANRLGVRFVMTVGNMIDGETDPETWADRVRAHRSAMAGLEMPWYPTPGRLDTAIARVGPGEAREMYRERFGPMTYSFDSGWAHVVVLSSERLGEAGQVEWLREDLAATGGEQVFVFVHEPVWREDPERWAPVHRVLRDRRLPTRVISGGTRYARLYGQEDNVRYASVPATGAYGRGTHEYASFQGVTLVHVDRGGHELTLLPHDAALAGTDFRGSDAEAVRALAESGWASVEGFVQAGPNPGDGAGIEVVLENPTGSRFSYEVDVLAPEGWAFSREKVAGSIAPGQTVRLPVLAGESPPLDGGRPEVEVVVTAWYPVRAGGMQAVIRRLDVPVRPRGADEVSGPTPENNGVLALDGRGAVRVMLGERPWRLTVECWVRGERLAGGASLVSRYQDGRGWGLNWSRSRGVLPAGLVGTDRGLARAGMETPPEWGEWRHLALTYDGSRAVLYVDGREAGRSERAGEILHGDLPLLIGAEPSERGDPVSLFRGQIDEVRVSSVVRYDGAFRPREVFETDEHTLLLMHFDTGYHGAFPDDSGRGRHGWRVGSGVEIERAER